MSTTDESVPENALAGTIPTEIGQLAELRELHATSNQITGVCLQCFCCMVNECTTNLKRPCCCTGNIPTELGRCTAMKGLSLRTNQLTGTYFFAHIARLVYECTTN